jgi:hypothetical protein
MMHKGRWLGTILAIAVILLFGAPESALQAQPGAFSLGDHELALAHDGGGNAYLDAHELGHTLDWIHANFWQAGPGQSPISPDGKEVPYGDAYDIMGDQTWGQHPAREFHQFNPWYKSRVGWIPPENVRTVTASGTYALQPYEQVPDEGTPVRRYTALRIPRDPEKDYWVFWRLEEPQVKDGVVVMWGFHTNKRSSVLLDMAPGLPSPTDDWKDVALGVGRTFSDPQAGIEIELVERTADEMKVRVRRSDPPVRHLPVIDVVRPARGQTVQGEVVYEVTAYDPDAGNGSGIAGVRFELVQFRPGEQRVTMGTAEVTSPPYVWHFDARQLPTSVYFLEVTATGATGESNTVWYPHIVDNADPSAPEQVSASAPAGRSLRFTLHAGGAPLTTVYEEPFFGFDPSVLFDEQAGKFKLWYTVPRRGVVGIGYAESADGLVWDTEVPGTLPHVLEPTPGAWDRDAVETASVLKWDGRYWMWYYGYPCDRPAGEIGRVRCIGLATSDDGVHWQKRPQPVLKPSEPWEQPFRFSEFVGDREVRQWDGGVQEPTVLWDDIEQRFKMWYGGMTLESVTLMENGEPVIRDVRVRQIGYATSPDGIHWSKYSGNPVFTPLRLPSAATWEESFAVDEASVIPDPVQGYHLFYFSGFSLGHATSRDGIHWERDAANPMVVFQPSAGRGVKMYGGPSALLKNGRVYLYYMQSVPGATKWQDHGMHIGLATAEWEE